MIRAQYLGKIQIGLHRQNQGDPGDDKAQGG
jgi:hypothetical protein